MNIIAYQHLHTNNCLRTFSHTNLCLRTFVRLLETIAPRSLRPFRTAIPGDPPAVAVALHGNSWRFPWDSRPEWSQRTRGRSVTYLLGGQRPPRHGASGDVGCRLEKTKRWISRHICHVKWLKRSHSHRYEPRCRREFEQSHLYRGTLASNRC